MRETIKDLLGNTSRAAHKYYRNPGLLRPKKRLRQVPNIDSDRFVFVAGLHRSGTTILHQLLRAHPDVSGFENTQVPRDEGQFLQSVFKPDSAFGGPGRMAFDPNAHLTESSALVTDSNRNRLLREWGAYYDLDKRHLLEKSPSIIVSTRFFQALFPDARFVAIIRHPIVVSLSTHNWTKANGMPLTKVAEHWSTAHEIFLEDLKHLKNCLVLRYEDMTTAPEASLRVIQKYLDISAQEPREQVEEHNQRYLNRWERDVSNKDEVIANFDKAANPGLMERFGYSWQAPYTLNVAQWQMDNGSDASGNSQ